jgi:prefoldin subunit 5
MPLGETLRTYRDRISTLQAALSDAESKLMRITADRDRLAARMERLQTHLDNGEAMRCAHPSCQLCLMEATA